MSCRRAGVQLFCENSKPLVSLADDFCGIHW